MNVELTTEQQAFVRQGMESGRCSKEEDALRDALTLWETPERRRAELLSAVDEAEISFARGEGRKGNAKEELTQLAEDIKRRGLARLASNETKLINGATFRFFRSLPARNCEPQIGRREIPRFPSGASRSRIQVSNNF